MLLDCYYSTRVTKSTGNKPAEMFVFTNHFLSTYAQKKEHRSQSKRARPLTSEANQKWRLLTLSGYLLERQTLLRGISKKITFHSARHTHATLLLSHGVDIYTVSKLLGHKHVVSTERYAHMTDKLKVEAINKLNVLNR